MLFKNAIIALFATVAAAQLHEPVGEPSGNAISRPGLNEEVPKGKPFTITWQADTPNTISIVLYAGPAIDLHPAEVLVEGLANTGTFTWTPSTSLKSTGNALYGIRIIDDVNGQFQWSTQFGLVGEDTTPSSTPVASKEGYPTGKPSLSHYPTILSSSTAEYVESTAEYTPVVPTSVGTASSGYPIGTGYPGHNGTVVQPTKTPTVPSTLQTTLASATTGYPAESTGGAAGIKAGLGLAGIMAAAAAFL